MRAIAVVDRTTGEKRPVELEIGQTLWIRDPHGDVEPVTIEQLTAVQWDVLVAADAGGVECRFS